MYPTLRLCSSRVHQPLIKFLGKRSWPSTAEAPQAHPAAPAELKNHFADFVKKLEGSAESSSSKSSSKSPSEAAVFQDFWEAPSRFWKPRVRELEDAEVDAIMSGGASSF
ncbi:hypothetical protein BDQ12DRAFT_674456 [Crucibulum laeve]|uniref:Uncharacterized protein n=1 Tax=Crucibulum laeve TaxID=68775 RepID=A0A5C3MCS1_9AGAR|nr:hypothetical protein BDQ12DRAFT_674456 [Crucibulum laeve]